MRSLSILLVLPIALAASSGSTSPAAASSRIQWPWSSKSKEDVPFPGSAFDPDISSWSPRCLWAAWTASSKFDMSCFQNNKLLYFSSPSQVCSQKCLDNTVRLSQYMVQNCNLEGSLKDNEPVGYKHKNVVYLSWANRELASLVCNGPAASNSTQQDDSNSARCYSNIFAAESIRESGMMSDKEGDRSNICNECTHQWAKAIHDAKHRISPLLYYGHIPDAVRLASWISELCDYRLTPY